ncbi:Alpha/Beta hydrolase protein [Phaeosphaeriaceae sp. PMI808]|nr:Alpha/Beta hydrolase protein [Phaeosphaeriaceae sp. PMI808]
MAYYFDLQDQTFAEAIAGEPAPHIQGHVKAREILEVLQKHGLVSEIAMETIEVPGKGGPTTVVVFGPKFAPKVCPMVFYSHGGGWALGSPASLAPLMEDLARQSEVAMVFPCYTPAPGEQYPFQFEQTYMVIDYVVRNGHKHNLLVDSIALSGDSVGETHIKMKSYETYKDGRFLTADTMN